MTAGPQTTDGKHYRDDLRNSLAHQALGPPCGLHQITFCKRTQQRPLSFLGGEGGGLWRALPNSETRENEMYCWCCDVMTSHKEIAGI